MFKLILNKLSLIKNIKVVINARYKTLKNFTALIKYFDFFLFGVNNKQVLHILT